MRLQRVRISSCRFTEQPDHFAGCVGGGRRVLSSNEIAVRDHVELEVTRFGIDAAVSLEHVFDQERHRLGEANGFFFGIAEARPGRKAGLKLTIYLFATPLPT